MHDRGNLGPTPGIKGSFFTITYCRCSPQILDMFIWKKAEFVSSWSCVRIWQNSITFCFLNIDILLCGNYELWILPWQSTDMFNLMLYGDLIFIPCKDIICATISTIHKAECDSSLCCQNITFQSIKLLEDVKLISWCSFLYFMLFHSQTSWKSIALIIYANRFKCGNICSSWHPEVWGMEIMTHSYTVTTKMNEWYEKKSKVPCVNLYIGMRSVTP